ncbi:MAG: nucleotide disphospho-sugar-binding domain-containing protein [Actinomycetota bacterium]
MTGKTIVFFPEGAYGPTNNCVGIASVLRERGHRIVFVLEESFKGTLEAKGFEEALMRLKPPPEEPEEPGQFWKDFVRETAPVFRTSTFEQLENFIRPVWEELIGGAEYVDDRLREIWTEVAPDVIVEDNVVAFPAVPASGIPWVRIVSCNPLEMKDPELPPTFSGLPTVDPSGRVQFRRRYRDLHRPLQKGFSAFCEEKGAPMLPDGEFIHESPWLNLYLYPAEVDYQRSVPLGPTWHRLDSCVRDTDEDWELPAEVIGQDGKLIYLSLGSLGSADTELMNRLTSLLAKSSHRVIVSMGPQHEEIALHDRQAGAEFLPQTKIIPDVDLVITHGGNNTVTEAFHFGKPMMVLPLFWDQHDNAQRVHETGYGVRLSTYGFSEMEFFTALDRLLSDAALSSRMQDIATRLQADPGTVQAADRIERLAASGEPITR